MKTPNIILLSAFLLLSTSMSLHASVFSSPCEIITVDIINSVFHLSEVDVKSKPSNETYPSCRYTWEGSNVSSREIAGQKMESKIESTVNIVIVEQKVSMSSYEAALKSYSGSFEKIDIGENAVWSGKRKQATVYIDGRLFHVHVDVDADDEMNKENALELCQIIISKL